MSFAIIRCKLVHAKMFVTEAPLSRAPWYAIVLALCIGALALGLRAIFRKPEGLKQ